MRIIIKFFTVLLFVFLIPFLLWAKEFYFNYSDNDKYQLTIKSNIKIYQNNKYIGLQTNEMKGILNTRLLAENKVHIKGDVFSYNRSMRDEIKIGFEIEKSEEVIFILDQKGIISDDADTVFPPLQNLPFFPEGNIKVGDIYQGYGKSRINLYNSDKIDIIQILSTCRYSGEKNLWGEQYDFFEISYDYGKVIRSESIKSARGKHNLEFYYDDRTNKPVFIKDKFIDEFELQNGDKIKRDGFILYFYKVIIPMDKKILLADLTDDIEDIINNKDDIKEKLKDIDFKEKEEGISITINNLKFKPNSTELLDLEKPRLEILFKMLSKIKSRSFLIIGHTALFGEEKEQMRLSLERAKAIANYLINQGIPYERIFYQGKGAKEPVAPNDTEENMQKNRRVEIIILED